MNLKLSSGNSIRLADIAEKLNFDIAGNSDLEISSLKYANEADENSLAVAYSDKDVLNTAAKAVLTEPRIIPAGKIFVYCSFGNMGAAIAEVAKILIKEKICPDYEKPFPKTLKDNSTFGKNFLIGEGTFIDSFVRVGENVTIGKNCKIESGVYIGSDTCIGDNVIIRSGTRVGVTCHYHYEENGRQKSFCGVGRLFIKDRVEIGCNTVIQRGTLSNTVIGAGTIIGNLVEIAHDVKIGENCLIVSQVGICGNAEIGNGVKIFGQAGVVEWAKIGDGATVMSKTRVTRNIRNGETVSGLFSRPHSKELKRFAKIEKLIKEE